MLTSTLVWMLVELAVEHSLCLWTELILDGPSCVPGETGQPVFFNQVASNGCFLWYQQGLWCSLAAWDSPDWYSGIERVLYQFLWCNFMSNRRFWIWPGMHKHGIPQNPVTLFVLAVSTITSGIKRHLQLSMFAFGSWGGDLVILACSRTTVLCHLQSVRF